jgi:cytochrome c oxidase subunit 1
MDETLGKLHFWGTMIGAYAIFWPMHYMGMAGVPRRYYRFDTFDAFKHFDAMNQFITIAAIIVFALQVMFVVNFFYSVWFGKKVTNKNPWNSNTLEWTTDIQPVHGNWAGNIPTVHRWPYDYGKDGKDFTPQYIPLKEGEKDEGH